MKKTILLLSGLALAVCACHRTTDSLIGEWTVHRVNVGFDERRGTPESVRQIGAMERQNRISIDADSTLVFKSLGTERRGRASTDGKGNLYLDGTLFGQWSDGQITTVTPSPAGTIVVCYRK